MRHADTKQGISLPDSAGLFRQLLYHTDISTSHTMLTVAVTGVYCQAAQPDTALNMSHSWDMPLLKRYDCNADTV